jgi:cytochrome c
MPIPVSTCRVARRVAGRTAPGHLARIALLLAVLAIAPLGAGTAHANGDVKAGAKVFADECAECHSMKEGRNRKGPSIFGVVGRKAGTLSDYDYSDAIKRSGIVWNDDRLDAYLASPNKLVPGGKMRYDGLSNATARRDLLAYLKFFSQ